MAKDSKGFQFKQFFIAHDQCAMKVNTDGILLGAIANVAGCRHILDLGAGSGLITLMLAQRTVAAVKVVGVELDPAAFAQAQQNIAHSPWAERVQLLQADIFSEIFAPLPMNNQFDLIVSNPPYFEHSLTSRNPQRDLARAATQSHFTWLEKAQQWLQPQGKISLILPFEVGEKLIEQALDLGLYCIEKWQIHTKVGKPPKRIILTFCAKPQPTMEKSLAIYGIDNQYSLEFKQLTKDFYLNF